MEENKYVYCTNCFHFDIINNIPCCPFEEECNIYDCEDGRKFKERPYYYGL